jgi:4'-phosphopantetheinyl transferase EntD
MQTTAAGAIRGNPASLSPLLASLFPAGVVAAELRRPAPAELLLPAETSGSESFSPKRLAEFAAGRLCARRALAELGLGDFALRRGADRYPIWPDGIVGSITHTRRFCGAAVAPGRVLSALGLDAERVGGVTPELWPQICTAVEARWLEARPEPERSPAAAVIFSAKEAFYKCQYGLAGEWLDFHDIEIAIEDPWQPGEREAGTFRVWPTRPDRLAGLSDHSPIGRFQVEGDLVLAGIALPPENQSVTLMR